MMRTASIHRTAESLEILGNSPLGARLRPLGLPYRWGADIVKGGSEKKEKRIVPRIRWVEDEDATGPLANVFAEIRAGEYMSA
jgi:hypothetical protein